MSTPEPYVKGDLVPYGRIPESLLYDPKAPDRAVRLFGVLDRHNGPRGIYPSRTRLARLCGCSVDSVDRATRFLMQRGYVEVETRLDDTNRQKSNFYSLHFKPKGDGGSSTDATGESRTPAALGPSTPAATQGRTPAAGESRTPAAQNESQIERSPTGSKPASPASVDAATPKKERKRDPWMESQFAKVKLVCPTADARDGYSLLNRLKKSFSPIDVISRSLDRLVDQKLNLGVNALWQYAQAECQRQQVAKVATKKGGAAEPSKSNSRRANP